MYVCMYIYVYMYVYIHIHTHIHMGEQGNEMARNEGHGLHICRDACGTFVGNQVHSNRKDGVTIRSGLPAPAPVFTHCLPPEPTLSPTHPVPRGLLTLWAGLYIYIYIYMHVSLAAATAYQRTRTNTVSVSRAQLTSRVRVRPCACVMLWRADRRQPAREQQCHLRQRRPAYQHL